MMRSMGVILRRFFRIGGHATDAPATRTARFRRSDEREVRGWAAEGLYGIGRQRSAVAAGAFRGQ
jgi:hypothetical protein